MTPAPTLVDINAEKEYVFGSRSGRLVGVFDECFPRESSNSAGCAGARCRAENRISSHQSGSGGRASLIEIPSPKRTPLPHVSMYLVFGLRTEDSDSKDAPPQYPLIGPQTDSLPQRRLARRSLGASAEGDASSALKFGAA
jgi:hypothetical protein